MGVGVRRAHALGRQGQQLPLVVAGQRRPVLLHQKLRGFHGQQGARQAVAQIQHMLHILRAQVFYHGLQCRQITVNVG